MLDRYLTQRELAEKSGVSRELVADAEVGKSLPYPRNRRKLAAALGKRVEDLWG